MPKGLQERRQTGSSRPASMDEPAASIANEAAALALDIALPIASARNNALAALNFLDHQPPDLGEVREALRCLVGDADRAGEIIDRVRDHIEKTSARGSVVA